MDLIFWFIILILFSVVTSAYSMHHGKHLRERFKGEKTIYDSVHERLPDLTRFYYIYDYLLIIFMLPLIFTSRKYNKMRFVAQILKVIIPVMFIYCIMTSITITGPTTTHDRDFGGPLRQAIFGHESLLLISGHSCFVFTLVLTMKQFGLIDNMFLWGGLSACFALFASMSRNHYSIDPIVSLFVVATIFDFVNNRSAVLSVLRQRPMRSKSPLLKEV